MLDVVQKNTEQEKIPAQKKLAGKFYVSDQPYGNTETKECK